MVPDALRSLWAEPRPANPPARMPRDWVLVAALICWTIAEMILLRHDLAPLPMLLVAAVAVIAPLPWRRTHPLVAAGVAFGTLTVIDIIRIATGTRGTLPSSVSATLVLTYALFRWGSGREAAAGLALILVWLPITNDLEATTLAESAAGYAFFLSAAALGAAMRYRARNRIRDIDEAKTREREQLARELHDTVAHHVSGIAIQASDSCRACRALVATPKDFMVSLNLAPSRPRPAGPSRPPTPSAPSKPSPPSSTRRPKRSPSCAPSSASCAPPSRPSSRRSRGWPRSRNWRRMVRRILGLRSGLQASSTTSAPRLGPRCTASPRSPSPTRGATPATPPGSPWP